MKYEITLGLIFTIMAFYSTSLSLPFLNRIAKKFGIIDNPNFRKKHKGKISRSGGIAIFVGILAAFLSIYFLEKLNFIEVENFKLLSLIFTGCSLFFFIGLIDDLFDISPFIRLFLQFTAAAIIYKSGLNLSSISLLLPTNQAYIISLSNDTSIIFVSFWITGIVNSINWLDGLDGLASGFTTIVLIFLMIMLLKQNNYDLFYLYSGLLGANLGFLRSNYYPAKIFMGDSGSHLIGFSLATFTILNFSKINLLNGLDFENFNLLFAVLVLFIPIFDMFFVILNRFYKGNSPFFPDRSHLHLRLVDKGLSITKTVIIFYTFTFFCCLLTLYLNLN